MKEVERREDHDLLTSPPPPKKFSFAVVIVGFFGECVQLSLGKVKDRGERVHQNEGGGCWLDVIVCWWLWVVCLFYFYFWMSLGGSFVQVLKLRYSCLFGAPKCLRSDHRLMHKQILPAIISSYESEPSLSLNHFTTSLDLPWSIRSPSLIV